jgi:hypothetical protein
MSLPNPVGAAVASLGVPLAASVGVGVEEEAKSMAFSMVFSVWIGLKSGKNLPL